MATPHPQPVRRDMGLLRERWRQSWRDLSLQPDDATFESLVARYREPHRAYHNLRHIAECFAQYDSVETMQSAGAVGIALWFHDAIYDPRASDNEARSAEWARSALAAAGAGDVVVDAVEELILATRHDAVPEAHDAKIMVDIDLSILGAEEPRYREYETQVRSEYAWVNDDAFRLGRTAVIEKFLRRPSIYSTDHFRTLFEDRARKNLGEALKALKTVD